MLASTFCTIPFLSFVRSSFFTHAGLLQLLLDFLYGQMDCFWGKEVTIRKPTNCPGNSSLFSRMMLPWDSSDKVPEQATVSGSPGLGHCYLPCSLLSWMSTPQLTVTAVNAASNLQILNQFCFGFKYEVQCSASPKQLLDLQVVFNTLQQSLVQGKEHMEVK